MWKKVKKALNDSCFPSVLRSVPGHNFWTPGSALGSYVFSYVYPSPCLLHCFLKIDPLLFSRFFAWSWDSLNTESLLGQTSLSNFFLNLLIRFFRNCNWWQSLKNWGKWQFWIFEERSYCAQNGEIGLYMSQNQHFWTFLQI